MGISLSQWKVEGVDPLEPREKGGGGTRFDKIADVSPQLAAEYISSLTLPNGKHPDVSQTIRVMEAIGFHVMPRGWKPVDGAEQLGPQHSSVTMRVRYYGHAISRDADGNIIKSRQRDINKLLGPVDSKTGERPGESYGLFKPCVAEPFDKLCRAALDVVFPRVKGEKGAKDDPGK